LKFFNETQGKICVSTSFMEFVEHDSAHAAQFGVLFEFLKEQAFGVKGDACVVGNFVFKAYGIADFMTEAPSSFLRDSRRGRTRGDSSWFENYDSLGQGVGEQRRQARGLACTGFGDDDE
jgi:hypothetical protein